MSTGPSAAGALSDAAFHLVQVEMGLAPLAPERSVDILRSVDGAADLAPPARALVADAAERLAAAAGYGPDREREAAREAGLLIERALSGSDDESHDPFPPAADPELLEAFVTESLEGLDASERAGLDLESRGHDPEALNTIFRCFHTIKGTAGFLGLDSVVDLAHAAESLLGRIREEGTGAGPGDLERVFQAIDELRRLVRATGEEADADEAGWRRVAAELDRAASARGGQESGPPSLAADRRGEPDAAPADEPAGESAGESASEHATVSRTAWTRVRTDRLDQLVDAVGELVIAHSMLAREADRPELADPGLERRVAVATAMLRDLQDLAISMRMVPVRGLFQRVARAVSDLARRRGAGIDFVATGDDTEIDRNLVELVADPLLHMVRNAVDHGIEPADERLTLGKSERGTLSLSAASTGGSVVIELRDDGRGLDRARIQERARAAGLLADDRELSSDELLAMITAPGFSTSERVTDVSGRGVGMDVVRRNVEALQGTLSLVSTPGEGCVFTLRLPLTLAITEGMLVRIGEERFVIPTASIRTSLRPEASALTTLAGGAELVRLGDELVPLVRLHRILGVREGESDPCRGIVVVAGPAERPRALLVDELLEQIHVVAKPLPGFGALSGVSGAAVLSDGRVGLILDVASIGVRRAAANDRSQRPSVGDSNGSE